MNPSVSYQPMATSEQCCKWCLAKVLKVNGRDAAGLTPSLLAAVGGNLVELKCLASKHCQKPENDFSTYGDDSALHLAASAGHLHVVNWLLDTREMYNCVAETNSMGRTPFMEAVREGHDLVVDAFLRCTGYSRIITLLRQVDHHGYSVFQLVCEEHAKLKETLIALAAKHKVELPDNALL